MAGRSSAPSGLTPRDSLWRHAFGLIIVGTFFWNNRALILIDKSLEPGSSLLISVDYSAANNSPGTLPSRIRASVDGANRERECREDNNEIETAVDAGERLADLRLQIGAATGGCASPRVQVTVHNDGSAPASNVLVQLYAGDPSQGGRLVGSTTIAGPIAPGASSSATVTLEPLTRTITVHGLTDPLNEVAECNNANNAAVGPTITCAPR